MFQCFVFLDTILTTLRITTTHQDRVKRLDPLRIDVPVAHDPRRDLWRLLHRSEGGNGQHAVSPLSRVEVDRAEELRTGEGLGGSNRSNRILFRKIVKIWSA